MEPNPILTKLGFSATDRVAILHTDDIGMCQASVAAFADLWEFGVITSGAIMVPCPWFLEAAAYARANPNADLGVHLTLTSEWKTYRWGPISTRDVASGMIDAEGYFFAKAAEAREKGDPAMVQQEMTAQIQRAINMGITPTHIDTHMGTVAHPKFISSYIQLSLHHRLPAMIARLDESGYQKVGLDPQTAAMAARMVIELEKNGFPLLDQITGMPLDTPENRLERTIQALKELSAGITHFIIHPSKDSPELRAITPDWACRVADYQTFQSPQLSAAIKNMGLYTIGYKAIKSLFQP
jgi:hypothetical protein